MQNLAHQRCFNHAAREAVAPAPLVRILFFRECITKHVTRMRCVPPASKKLARQPPQPAHRVRAAFSLCPMCSSAF